MNQPIHALRCKSCQELVEIPPLEPKVVTKTEPCKCGLTEGARTSRHTMLGVICSVTAIAFAVVGGTIGYNTTRVGELQAEIEAKKAEFQRIEATFKLEAQKLETESKANRSEAQEYKKLLDRFFVDKLPPEQREQFKKE